MDNLVWLIQGVVSMIITDKVKGSVHKDALGWVALIIGTVAGVLYQSATGHSLMDGMGAGAKSGLAAISFHELLTRLPGLLALFSRPPA